jgi:hypothetical protein
MSPLYNDSWLNEQRRATQALLHFCDERGRSQGAYIEHIRECLAALQRKDIDAAMEHYSSVPLGGNMCFNDWVPPPVHPGETPGYVCIVFEALVGHWSRVMNLSKPPESCRACGKAMIPGPLCLKCHLARAS